MSSVITQNRNASVLPKTELHHYWWQHAAQGFCFLLVAVALLEGYFRLAGVGEGQFLQPDLQLGTVHIPSKQVIWRMEGFSNNKMSSAGLRDTEHSIKKSPGNYRIALLGDSLVEALQVDLNDTYGKVLERLLNDSLKNASKNDKIKNYEVINFGCAGYSTAQEFLQYEQEAAKYKPDALVLLYNRGDSMESVVNRKDRKRAEPRPYFYIDSAGQLQEDNSILAANSEKLRPNQVMNFLRKNSTIYGVLCQADFALTLNEPRYRKIKEWIASGISRLTTTFTSNGLGKLRSYNNNDMASIQMDRAHQDGRVLYPDQDEMVVTKALISKLASAAAKNGRVFILVIYPNLTHYAALTEQARELKVMAEKNHFLYLDLSPSFLADPQPQSNFALYHFNKKGHLTVANQIFQLFSYLKKGEVSTKRAY